MIQYFVEYSFFALQAITVLLLIFLPFMLIMKAKISGKGASNKITIEHVNTALENSKLAFESILFDKKALKQRRKNFKRAQKKGSKLPIKKRSFVCRFDGDLKASQVEQLRREITAILLVTNAGDEVILVLNSAGGTIHGYGLAASQLSRLREKGVSLSVCVDSVAASGGYMMACVADHLSAAPFAIIGSVGVIAQIPNFNKVLKEKNIEYEQITAGEHKRTLTMFGENTIEGRTKFQSEIDDAHQLFKDFIAKFRPNLDIENIATGEHWFASKAIELGLVDAIATSDEVIMQRALTNDVYEIKADRKKSAFEKLLKPSINSIVRLIR
jgi:serine protease SohB